MATIQISNCPGEWHSLKSYLIHYFPSVGFFERVQPAGRDTFLVTLRPPKSSVPVATTLRNAADRIHGNVLRSQCGNHICVLAVSIPSDPQHRPSADEKKCIKIHFAGIPRDLCTPMRLLSFLADGGYNPARVVVDPATGLGTATFGSIRGSVRALHSAHFPPSLTGMTARLVDPADDEAQRVAAEKEEAKRVAAEKEEAKRVADEAALNAMFPRPTADLTPAKHQNADVSPPKSSPATTAQQRRFVYLDEVSFAGIPAGSRGVLHNPYREAAPLTKEEVLATVTRIVERTYKNSNNDDDDAENYDENQCGVLEAVPLVLWCRYQKYNAVRLPESRQVRFGRPFNEHFENYYPLVVYVAAHSSSPSTPGGPSSSSFMVRTAVLRFIPSELSYTGSERFLEPYETTMDNFPHCLMGGVTLVDTDRNSNGEVVVEQFQIGQITACSWNRGSEVFLERFGFGASSSSATDIGDLIMNAVTQATAFGSPSDDCPICLERMDRGQSVVITKCRHRFHGWCLYRCLVQECPICRAQLEKRQQ